MKIKVGMWVRTDDGFITKILGIIGKDIYNDSHGKEVIEYGTNREYQRSDKYNSGFYMYSDWVVKASHNIVDLIEVGDYVNGSEVCMIKPDENNRLWIYTDSNYKVGIMESEIKTILTHEQFEREAYKVWN